VRNWWRCGLEGGCTICIIFIIVEIVLNAVQWDFLNAVLRAISRLELSEGQYTLEGSDAILEGFLAQQSALALFVFCVGLEGGGRVERRKGSGGIANNLLLIVRHWRTVGRG
jgi:uncharacterized transporter YbjL